MTAYSEVQQHFWPSSFCPQQDAECFITNPIFYMFFMENLEQGVNNDLMLLNQTQKLPWPAQPYSNIPRREAAVRVALYVRG